VGKVRHPVHHAAHGRNTNHTHTVMPQLVRLSESSNGLTYVKKNAKFTNAKGMWTTAQENTYADAE
jgi:hypothetical protein